MAAPAAREGWSRVRGGVTFFRSGGGAAARAYLEQDHARADDYYLAEGSGLADRIVHERVASAGVFAVSRDVLSGDAYESWVDWQDPITGEVRGRPRERSVVDPNTGEQIATASSPMFAEMTVNADKTLSIAAAADPAVSAALDVAMRAAAEAMTAYLAENSVTRVGPLGAQRLVDVDRFEAAYVMHQTSRAGDPHRHAHLQFSTRVYAEGKWRALDTATTLRQQGALRGVGEAVINSHPQLRAALAEAGFTFDPSTGRVVELEQYAEGMSKRAEQITRNRDGLEAAWRAEHPGQQPGPAAVRSWDRHAWNLDRPNKKPTDLSTAEGWLAELIDAGYTPPTAPVAARAVTIASLNRDAIAAEAVQLASQNRSAWSVADLTDQAAHLVAASGVVAGRVELGELVDDLTARAQARSVSLADPTDGVMPDALRHLTSAHVLDVDSEIHARIATRALRGGVDAKLPKTVTVDGRTLGGAQRDAVAMIAGTHQMCVFEGAAGAGKTTALLAAKLRLEAQGRTMVVVAPTLKAAQEAGAATGSDAASVHALVRAHGWRWTEDGTWYRLQAGEVDHEGNTYRGVPAQFRLTPQHVVVVDEAGMIDQELGLAFLTVVDDAGASFVLAGDRAQKGPVGRGGFFDAAAQRTHALVDVDQVHRFVDEHGNIDQEYAALSLQMRDRRDPGQVFDQLVERGLVHVHAAPEDAHDAIAAAVAEEFQDGRTVAVTATTNAEATQINDATRTRLVAAGVVDDTRTTVGMDGLPIGRGDRIMTRDNDREVGVANRETFTVAKVHRNGTLTVISSDNRRHTLPADYVTESVHLSYAVTDYGNQGATHPTGHLMHGDGITADGQYVGQTRGRTANHVHLVADDLADARRQFIDGAARDNTDRGINAAREALREQTAGLDLTPRDATRDRIAQRIEEATRDRQAQRQQVSPETAQKIRDLAARIKGEKDAAPKALPAQDQAIIKAERQRRLMNAAQAEKALRARTVQDAHKAAVEERRAAWVSQGHQTPEDARQTLTQAQERLTAAQGALDAAQTLHDRAVSQEAGRARLAADPAARRISEAERAVYDANVFTRPRARAAVDEARSAAAAQFGVPVPAETSKLYNSTQHERSWIDQIGDRARAAAEARPDPALATARETHQVATRDRTAAEQAQATMTARYEAEVIRPEDPLTQQARNARTGEFVRSTTEQLTQHRDRTRTALDNFDKATPAQQLAAAEKHFEREPDQATATRDRLSRARSLRDPHQGYDWGPDYGTPGPQRGHGISR